MLTAESPMPLRWGDVDRQRMAMALSRTRAGPGWRVAHLAPLTLAVEGDEASRRLRLGVAVYLVGPSAGQHAQLRLSLVGDAWAHGAALPPVSSVQALEARVPDTGDAPLTYILTDIAPQVADDAGEASWLQYLAPAAATLDSSPESPPAEALDDYLATTLARWLAQTLAIDTVGGAIDLALEGPVGHFGPVEHHVLERTGQADLAVDVTLLGEADDVAEQGGEGTTFLALYGERHGVWLLHRRIATPGKPRQKGVPVPRAIHCEVVVAEDVDSLIATVGLGIVEKRLFQAAGLMPHATLWSRGSDSDHQEAQSDRVDLSGLPERSRRHLQAIASLSCQGKLSAADIDLLLRTARHLSKSGR